MQRDLIGLLYLSLYLDNMDNELRDKINKKFGQYKADIFDKLGIDFKKRRTLLDIGCGDCSDATIFSDVFGLSTTGTDVYQHENVAKWGINFKLGNIFQLPFDDDLFDYVFLHDVLHHVDEENQSYEKHMLALTETGRVLKKGGTLIIIEGNRYNPLFYPHMVKQQGHEHFRQSYFRRIMNASFPGVLFKYFEAHLYPKKLLKIFKLYEGVMEKFSPRQFLAYNVAIWNK